MSYYVLIDATVGFELSSYTVSEDNEQVTVCVAIDETTEVAVDFMVKLSTTSGTAGKCFFHDI